ncbi:glycosyltransferase family 9 protein [Mycobacterium sp. E2989]|uniref:glycosyltransferase family 9 protein n=1 Tax=Mycobacterium sp. E2989 TaxID=1834140 RepID=UPI0007FEB17B|nr:glycosyltransferase family 9 protein [Mycobacterium sp. E2989]OBH83493.1 hypothetical protein A5680_11655 [Mycobacterium sp. E2989]
MGDFERDVGSPGRDSVRAEPEPLTDLLHAARPALCFVSNIGDSVLTLPAVRALAGMFTAPITMICPKVAFDLCFREVSSRHVDTAGLPFTASAGPPSPSRRPFDFDALAGQIGDVDVFIDTLTWSALSNTIIGPLVQRITPKKSIGFVADYGYDVVIGKEECHAADLMFKLARLFDPSLRIESYAQPVPIPPPVQEEARSMRAALPPGAKVLVVHADTNWPDKRWPATRFIDLLDRFLSRHHDFVAWIVGMGHEELNVGRERDRIFAHLGLPLDLAMGMVAAADLFVGIDSCMLHAADLARVPGVGLFGPTRADTWGFRFGPHRHVDKTTMADITVDEVLAAMDELAERRQ